MTDAELRALVRDAVARHFAAGAAPERSVQRAVEPDPSASFDAHVRTRGADAHPSHAMYMTVVNIGDSCVIEPGVTCNHCGYCKSHGH